MRTMPAREYFVAVMDEISGAHGGGLLPGLKRIRDGVVICRELSGDRCFLTVNDGIAEGEIAFRRENDRWYVEDLGTFTW